jgi:hypothetical protein
MLGCVSGPENAIWAVSDGILLHVTQERNGAVPQTVDYDTDNDTDKEGEERLTSSGREQKAESEREG